MRGSAFIAFFGIATAISGSLIGCGDEDATTQPGADKVTKSGAGESCLTTNDCAEGLACFGNTCLEQASGTGGSGGSGTGGTTSNPTLGAEGESCTRRADCAPGLGCFNQRCAETDTGEGGGGNIPPTTVGARGETCNLSSDCAAGLVCLPGGSMTPGTGAIGVCTDQNTDVTATGMICGAECERPADCCQIPLELHEAIAAKSCADLADLLDGVTCDAMASAVNQARCLVNDAYCAGCDANTWDCTAGSCIYAAACTDNGLVPGGCPTFSRTGFPLPATCDVMGTERCMSPVVDPLCETDADCEGLSVSDDMAMVTDICNGGECTCFEARCLRRCDSPLDCRVGFTCETSDEVCVPEGVCSVDETCKAFMGDIRAECVMGACTLPCATDLDCNPAGLVEGTFSRVCGTDGLCMPLGCNDDTDCGNAMTGVRTFCTTPEAAAGVRGAQSAITD